MQPAIEIENVSKLYKLGYYGADTFRDEVINFFRKLAGKPPVNAPIDGQGTNKLDQVDSSDLVWALKDINLTIQQGDIVGIIGKNGAGKSTLLKILSKITTPTTGKIKVNGRMASLLEVGTGMHPELSGRDNIYLNGAILGMRKHEITSKLDDIVDFSGIAKYIDTPIKRYSSGMRVRLGFAISAFLEPEILVVDEVLAVGDAEFQKRAIGKMQDISQGNGRTVLFVSHNMTSIKNLCKSGVMMQNGTIAATGDINEIVAMYQANNAAEGTKNNYWTKENAPGENGVKIKAAYIEHEGSILTVKDPFKIVIEYWCEEDLLIKNVIQLFDISSTCVFDQSTERVIHKKGLYKTTYTIPGGLMNDGTYFINTFFNSESKTIFTLKNCCKIEILENREKSVYHGRIPGIVRPDAFITKQTIYLE